MSDKKRWALSLTWLAFALITGPVAHMDPAFTMGALILSQLPWVGHTNGADDE